MKIKEFLELESSYRDGFICKEIMKYCPREYNNNGDVWLWNTPDGGITTTINFTTWEGMRLVVEKMHEHGFGEIEITSENFNGKHIACNVFLYNRDDGETSQSYRRGDTSAPLAVCIAAGLALGVLEED